MSRDDEWDRAVHGGETSRDWGELLQYGAMVLAVMLLIWLYYATVYGDGGGVL